MADPYSYAPHVASGASEPQQPSALRGPRLRMMLKDSSYTASSSPRLPPQIHMIPSPHDDCQTLPSIKDLALPTPPTSGEFPKLDDFEDDRSVSFRSPNYHGPDHHYHPDHDRPWFDHAVPSRQSTASPRTDAAGFSSLLYRDRRYKASRSRTPLHLYNVIERDDIIRRHALQRQSRYEELGVRMPTMGDYQTTADVWQDSRGRFRSYGPWDGHSHERHERDLPSPSPLQDKSPNQQPVRRSMPHFRAETSYPPPSAYRSMTYDTSLTSSSPPPPSRVIDPEAENRGIYSVHDHRQDGHSRPLGAKRPRFESPETLDPDEACETALTKRKRSSQSSRRTKAGSESSLQSAKEAKHSRNRSTKERKSTNYLDYPDYCPPTSVMQEAMRHAREVKAQGVKNPVDLSADPIRDQLHEAEVMVAQALNLSGESYLLVKRQLFAAYVDWLQRRDEGRQSGNWNKTAAQKCSNIDVGKTSQIWVFFNAVGWFEEKHFGESQ